MNLSYIHVLSYKADSNSESIDIDDVIDKYSDAIDKVDAVTAVVSITNWERVLMAIKVLSNIPPRIFRRLRLDREKHRLYNGVLSLKLYSIKESKTMDEILSIEIEPDNSMSTYLYGVKVKDVLAMKKYIFE